MSFAVVFYPAVFLLTALWEVFQPARSETTSISLRWFGNIVLLLLSWMIVTLLPFITGFGAALLAGRHGWGLLNVLQIPAPVGILLSFVVLDLLAYWEHRLFHASPLMWRLHALHHSDPDLDVTTSIRHHPLEVAAQSILDASTAVIFGFPAAAIALYGLVVTVNQTIHHGNVLFPKELQWIGKLIVTPDLHRVHHSVAVDENNSNFSNFFTLWDRLFGTLRVMPRGDFRVGLAEFATSKFQRLDGLLATPWLVPRPQLLAGNAGDPP